MNALLDNPYVEHAALIARYLRGGPQAVLWALSLDEVDYMIISAAAELAGRREAEASKSNKPTT